MQNPIGTALKTKSFKCSFVANDFECVFIQFQRLLQQNTRSLRHSASNGNNLLEYETFDFSKKCDFFDIREECAIMALWDEKKNTYAAVFFS